MKSLLCSLLFLLHLTSSVYAAAPARSGQPYAEVTKCAAAGVILCEDFDYPANFTCGADIGGGGQVYAWSNPGWAVVPTGSACAGKSLVTQASVPTQPFGSPTGGYVKRVDPDDGEGQDVGCLWGDCDRATDDSPTGQTYANGMALSNDLYFRFQIYFSSDYKWPDFDNKIFFMWPNRYVDKPSANVDAGMIFGNGVFCPTFNENFNDALSFRVGSNAGNFKIYPADANTDGYAEHPEYCLGDGYGNNSPDISRVDPPDDTPHPGRVFRFKKATWYTIEFRYKLGNEGVDNGIIEAWVNGTKVYSDSDLETCGDGLGNCAAVQEIVQYFWYNAFQEGGDLAGYGLFDNLIISTNYIGPPTVTVAVGPKNYWVAKTGSDSNDCLDARTEETPKLTITSGAACLTPGDTLTVKAGTYVEQLTDEIPGGDSWSAPVTVQAKTGDVVTLAPGAGGDGAVYFTTAASQYIILDGINLDGTGETTGHGIIINGGAHHIRIQNAEIQKFWNTGILVGGATANNNEFLNLKVHDNGTRPDQDSQNHGVWIETDNNLIEGCTICNHTGHGIYVYSANAWQPDNNFLHQNLVYANTTIGIGMYGGAGNVARNNMVYDSTNAGIKVSGTSPNVTFNTIYSISEAGGYSETGSGHVWRNNIFADSGDYGLWLAAGVTATVQNNLFFNNTDGTIDNDAGATITGTVTGDPLFVNATGGNLHIETDSVARDAATSLPAITVDIDGDVRPNGAAQDIGADEMAGGVRPLAPSGLSGGLAGAGGGNFR